MTSDRNDVRRVMLALWETSSLQDLWRAALQHISDAPAELVTVFVTDDRWRRAASLPFTREVSRFGGATKDFTKVRAEQLDKEAVAQAEGRVKKLATEARIQFSFTVLGEHEALRIGEFVTSESDLLIAPAVLKRWPIYAEIARLNCRILLVDTQDDTTRTNDGDGGDPGTQA